MKCACHTKLCLNNTVEISPPYWLTAHHYSVVCTLQFCIAWPILSSNFILSPCVESGFVKSDQLDSCRALATLLQKQILNFTYICQHSYMYIQLCTCFFGWFPYPQTPMASVSTNSCLTFMLLYLPPLMKLLNL